MPWIDSLDWSSLNALRRYPIREGLSAQSIDEIFNIPDTLIVDFALAASSNVEDRFYVSKVFNKISSVVIEISDWGDNVVGTFQISSSDNLDVDFYMTATSDYTGASGKITIGTLADLASQPAGLFSFSKAATEFEPRTIIPGLQGIDRISFIDVNAGTHTMTGHVKLASRSNLRFSLSSVEDNSVLLDAGDDLGLNKQCAVTNCVKRINGVAPDPATGNISLLGIDCVTVKNNEAHTLDIEDKCCSPCVGCNDLQELTLRLTSLENNFLNLKNNYNNVNNQLSTYLATTNSDCECPA
jgi:hypothetical protein